MKASHLLVFVTSIILWLVSTLLYAMQVSTGTLHHIEKFPSAFVDAKDVYIWLPEGYNREKQYAVLYMHDAQMLFDATVTWNKQEWQVDEVAGKLMREGKVKDFIVVASTNGDYNNQGKRMNEYFPQKPFANLSASQQQGVLRQTRGDGKKLFVGPITSDNYLKFLVQELKPYIDKTFSVKANPENTAVMGASMGGLISLYAISEYPQVFGAAACISTHWPGAIPKEDNPIPQTFFSYMQTHLPGPNTHKIYFSLGTETLDKYYRPLQAEVDNIMSSKGYSQKHWQTRLFAGDAHDEESWAKRLHMPMIFLFGKE